MRLFAVLGGANLIAAGVAAFYGAALSVLVPAALVADGVALVLTAKRRKVCGPLDTAMFVISILVLSAVGAGLAFTGGPEVTYSATSSQVSASGIDLAASTNFGAIHVSFSNDPALAYRVVFYNPPGAGLHFGGTQHSFSADTAGTVLTLKASAEAYSINVTIGSRYHSNVNASSSLGSVSFEALDHHNLEKVRLSASLGSIEAVVRNSTIAGLDVSASTGSADVELSGVRPAPQLSAPVPINVDGGTGSITFSGGFTSEWAVSLSASSGLGSVSQSLQGFTIDQQTSSTLKATAGDPGTTQSFAVTLKVGTGSVSIDATWG